MTDRSATPNGDPAPGFLTGFSLLLPITLSTMAIVLLAPILPQLLSDFSTVPAHEYWVPMILTIPALCVPFFSPLAGMVGDRFGRRRLVLPAILLSRVGVGLAEAAIMVLSTTMIGDYYKGAARCRLESDAGR
ncbi:MFS transporter [Sphingobium sp. Z007]|uniref:MFS transporter n=1 Tax=Sphingobium sp. Z007 TaxID=627495 RepID=UPI000B4A366A|nr:MFS transporter [Sphingobium sp. Z007]